VPIENDFGGDGFFFSSTDSNGTNSAAGAMTLRRHGKCALPRSEPHSMVGAANGTFTFSSDVPCPQWLLRGLINERLNSW